MGFGFVLGFLFALGFFVIIVVFIRKVSKARLHLEWTTTCSVCWSRLQLCYGEEEYVSVQHNWCETIHLGCCEWGWETNTVTIHRSGLKPLSRSQEWTVSITFSHFPINLEEVTLNKQRCLFCSVVYRNMVLPSFSHGIHCSGQILFCINRTFLNQKFCTEENIWELKLNLASGLTNRIFSTFIF